MEAFSCGRRGFRPGACFEADDCHLSLCSPVAGLLAAAASGGLDGNLFAVSVPATVSFAPAAGKITAVCSVRSQFCDYGMGATDGRRGAVSTAISTPRAVRKRSRFLRDLHLEDVLAFRVYRLLSPSRRFARVVEAGSGGGRSVCH